jgi:hypothetical protein
MLQKDVKIGAVYYARISTGFAYLRIDAETERSSYGLKRQARKGWIATNLRTGREIRILSAAKLRKEVSLDVAMNAIGK